MKIKDMIGKSNAKLIFGDINADVNFKYFSKDSRTVNFDDVFLGIKGDNFNGNDYWEEAFRKGASTCILSEDININDYNIKEFTKKNLIVVDNMEEFLVLLAKPIRSKLNIPIIAVTGSVGKTSTKNIIADILETKYKVLKTSGNLNTLIGLALTLLKATDEEIAVIEMGMNHAREISVLSNFLKPDIAVITNIGTAHIGILGSRENILAAKLEILEGLKGPIFINNDNDLLHEWTKNNFNNYQIITYGIEEVSDYQGKSLKYDKYGSHFQIQNKSIDINVIGRHFIYNSLIAYAIGDYFHIDSDSMIQKLANIPLEKDRMELIRTAKMTILNDTYNASYDSVFYALEVLGCFDGRKIAVLGDIGELGEYSEEIHRKIGPLIIKNNIDILITVGEFSHYINEEAINLGFIKKNSYHLNDKKETIKLLNEIKKDNDNFLIKASNSMKFNEIVDGIKE